MENTHANSILTQEILQNYPSYLSILTQPNSKYTLCVPPNKLLLESCIIDDRFIQEHILEKLGDQELRSISGKPYKRVEFEIQQESTQEAALYTTIKS
jgi:hypothetical protein